MQVKRRSSSCRCARWRIHVVLAGADGQTVRVSRMGRVARVDVPGKHILQKPNEDT